MTAEQYHSDPAPTPSLSSSIARLLITASPRHAWCAHPKLNPGFQSEDDETKFDLGTAAHAYLLEGADHFTVIDAPDWRTKAAKEARDVARKAGRLPLLRERWADVVGMAEAARDQLAAYQESPRPFTGGAAEQTLLWQEGGIWCRARLDWLHEGHRVIDDLKSTGGSAHPDVWIRNHLFSTGFDVQAAFYLRGLKAVTGQRATFRFVVIEDTPPYALSVVALGPEALELAERKVAHAIEVWRHCVETNTWPAYPARTCFAEVPAWESARWLEQEVAASVPRIDDGRPLADQLLGG
jgi:hypothetical protein